MKNYRVEIHQWNEVVPDDGLWYGENFPDGVDAESTDEAFSLVLAWWHEQSEGHEGEFESEIIDEEGRRRIEWRNENDDRCAIEFRIKEAGADEWEY
jgi:hypothetical protein